MRLPTLDRNVGTRRSVVTPQRAAAGSVPGSTHQEVKSMGVSLRPQIAREGKTPVVLHKNSYCILYLTSDMLSA